VVATEFVTPSVTAASAFDSIASNPALDLPIREVLNLGQEILKQVDSWFRYVDLSRHGYMAVDIDAARTQVDWYHGDVLTPDAPVTYTTSYQAVHGSPGARQTGGEVDRSLNVF